MVRIYKNYVVLVGDFDYIAAIDTGKQDKNGKQTYKRLGYYSSLRSAVKGIAQAEAAKLLKDNDRTLNEACEMLNDINAKLEDILQKIEG